MKSEDLNIENSGRERTMYFGASPMLFEIAKELRGKMTQAEEILWSIIKINDWNLNFRRQHPISIYIADFYCHKIKLVIELDEGYHQNKDVKIYDEVRENDIKKFGITVLRFKNDEVLYNIENVLIKINSAITSIQITNAEKADYSKTSPSGVGGKTSPLGAGGKTSPPGDGAKLFVIKIGGNTIDDEKFLQSFLRDFASINDKKILVHGGGKIATKIGDQLGIQSNYINGRRITDEATIDLVTMVYGGLINKKIVAKLQSMQCNAIGLTGADANIIPATKRGIINLPIKDFDKEADCSKTSPSGAGGETDYSKTSPLGAGGKTSPSGAGGSEQGQSIDYGFAGDINVSSLNTDNLEVLLSNNFIPVIAPLTHDGKGQLLNTNADTIASALAVSLSDIYDVRLIYCFEKKGVLEDVDNESSVIPLITKEKYLRLLEDKKLFAGILPKIDNAFAAIENGVKEVLIGDANNLLQNVTANVIGTLIK